jgi:predicted metal-binding membrane protein
VTTSTTGTRLESPRTAYRVLERRATLGCVAVLLGLAGAAWWATVRAAGDMADMPLGLGAVGTAVMPFDMAAGVFLLMWLTMMVAMMLPTVAPVVLLHRMVMRRAGAGPQATVAFGAGYLAVWAAVGVVPLAALVGFRQVADGADWVAPLSGGVLVAAGLYQFTTWKRSCQRACQTPLTFLATHDFGHGPAGAFRTGVAHGVWCLGCCWALMAVLFVVGLMNLVWMALISLVFLAEKHTSGRWVAWTVGVAVVALGVGVLLDPEVLAWLTGVEADPGGPAPTDEMEQMPGM